MPVLVVRHAQAAPPKGGDRERHLTLVGRQEAAALAHKLRTLGHVPTTIVSSPLVRAVQTAEIIAHVLGYASTIAADPAFEPDEDAAEAVRAIPSAGGLVMVVSHEPIVRHMAAILAGQPSFAGFKTAGAALFDARGLVARIDA